MAKPALVYPNGDKIDFSTLTREVAGATVSGVRSVVTANTSGGLTPERLARILRQAENGDAVAYLELAEQMEEKDLHYLGVLGQRKRGVAQLEITVEAATDSAEDQANAEAVREALKRDTLEDELFDILDAVGKGFSLTEMIWDFSAKEWSVARFKRVDPRFVGFDRTDGETAMLMGEDGILQPLDPFKFVFTEIKAKSGLPIRGGLARPVSWAWMFKNFTIKDWAAFAEVYGLPWRIGKYGPNATPQEKATLLRAVTSLGHDAAAIIPASMEVDLVGGAQAGTGEVFKDKLVFWNDQISIAVVGQTATTDAKIGGLGSGKEHGEVREDIARADAKSVAAALNRDFVRPYVDLNRGRPASGRYPRVMIGRADAWDPQKMMPAVREFVSMGGRVGQSYIRDRLGIEDPGPDEPLLTPPTTVQAQTPPEDPQQAPGKPAAQKPRDPAAAPTGRANPVPASQGLLAPLKPASRSGGRADGDAIDDLAEELLAEWRPMVQGVVGGVETLLADCSDLEEFRDRLSEAIAAADVSALVRGLATGAMNTRLAGLVGQALTAEQQARLDQQDRAGGGQ